MEKEKEFAICICPNCKQEFSLSSAETRPMTEEEKKRENNKRKEEIDNYFIDSYLKQFQMRKEFGLPSATNEEIKKGMTEFTSVLRSTKKAVCVI